MLRTFVGPRTFGHIGWGWLLMGWVFATGTAEAQRFSYSTMETAEGAFPRGVAATAPEAAPIKPAPLRNDAPPLVPAAVTESVPRAVTEGMSFVVPDMFPTIQAAIDGSPDGSTILVKPGVYDETLTLVGRELVLQSLNGAGATVINPRGFGSVFSIQGGIVTIQGFTITNGQASGEASAGGGVNFVASGNGQPSLAQLLDNVITANVAHYGGGISAVAEESANATIVLERNSISGNQALNSGGGLAAGAGAESSITVTSRDNVMADNTRGSCGTEIFLNPNGASAAVSMDSSGDRLSNGAYRIQEICTYALEASRLTLEMRGGKVKVDGLTSVGASSTSVGGSSSRILVADSEGIGPPGFVLVGLNTAGLFLGVGADPDSEVDVVLERNTITGFGLPGNGVDNAVIIDSAGQASVDLRNNRFATNEPTMTVSNSGTMDLKLAGNTIVQGCNALIVTNSGTLTADLLNNAIVDNGVMCDVDCRGCALFLDDRTGSSFRLVNNTISGNLGPSAVYLSSAGMTDVSLTNNILFGNVGRDFYNDGNRANVTISHSDLGSTFGSYTDAGGNISADPQFVDSTSESCDFLGQCSPWNRDYSLLPGSPCIDAGTSEGAPTDDLEGNLRPFGAAVDLGAFEHGYMTPTPTPTVTPTPTATATLCLGPGICVDPIAAATTANEITIGGTIDEPGWESVVQRADEDPFPFSSVYCSRPSRGPGERFSSVCTLAIGQVNSFRVSVRTDSVPGCFAQGRYTQHDCDGGTLDVRQIAPIATTTRTSTSTATPTATAAPTDIALPSSTATSVPTDTPTAPATATVPGSCMGDCNGDGRVAIEELVLAVAMALDRGGAQCPTVDRDGNGSVTVDELVAAVRNALSGCDVGHPSATSRDAVVAFARSPTGMPTNPIGS